MVQVETHCHTEESSICGKVPARKLVKLYAKAGYAVVIITDHYNAAAWNSEDWDECMDEYLLGYKHALKAGKRRGVTVLQGIEIKFDGFEPYEFLVYGMDEHMLRAFPRLNELTPEEFGIFAQEHGLLVFEAHPFRFTEHPYMPVWYDGAEAVNGHPRHNSHNRLACEFALQNGLLMIAGSDFHREQDCGRGGVMLPERVDSIEGFIDYYKKNGSPELIITYEEKETV